MSEWVEIPELQIWGCRVALDMEHVVSDREELAEVVSGAMKDYLERERETQRSRNKVFIESLGCRCRRAA